MRCQRQIPGVDDALSRWERVSSSSSRRRHRHVHRHALGATKKDQPSPSVHRLPSLLSASHSAAPRAAAEAAATLVAEAADELRGEIFAGIEAAVEEEERAAAAAAAATRRTAWTTNGRRQSTRSAQQSSEAGGAAAVWEKLANLANEMKTVTAQLSESRRRIRGGERHERF